MLLIKTEIDSLDQFEAWSGGRDTLNDLTASQRDELLGYLEDAFPDGCTDTELNDFLWFERDTINEWLKLDDEGNTIGSSDWAERVVENYYAQNQHLRFDPCRHMAEEYIMDHYDDGDYGDEDDVIESFKEFCFSAWKDEMAICAREFYDFDEMEFDDWLDEYFTDSDIQPYESFCEEVEQWIDDNKQELDDEEEDE